MKETTKQKEAVQLKEEAKSEGGKTMAPPAFNLTSGPIQRVASGPSGRGLCTEFGDYWIVPNGTTQCFADAVGEQITEAEFTALKAVYDKLKDGSGNVKVTETDSAGTEHAGFKSMIVGQLAKLLSKPTGRSLVSGLVNGSTTVTIRPSAAQIYGGGNAIRGGAGTLENADGTAGTGGTTIIQIDANLQDEDVMVYDAAGNEIALPVFITLGHELIHAQHNADGRNRRNNPATDASYSNQEEEETIATGELTENDLRTEHGLTLRKGHAGRDTR